MKYAITDHSASNSFLIPDMAYVKLPQDAKITSLYTLRPPREADTLEEPAKPEKKRRGRPRNRPKLGEVAEPELAQRGLKSGTFKIEQGENYIYIEDYKELTAHFHSDYRLNTYKLLDFAIWQLDAANRLPDGEGYMAPICTQLTLPLDFYIRCCGYEAEITASKRKDAQKELQKDLRLICATLIGWDDGSAVRILDDGCVRNGQIIVTFSERMADHLLHNCYCMWYPLMLLQLNGKSLMSYSMGRSMALHSSIRKNQLLGTDTKYSVRRLLQYCCDLPTPEEVRKRNGNYRQAIIRPFTAALDKLADLEIAAWNYQSLIPSSENGDDDSQTECEEIMEKYDDFLKDTVVYLMSGMPEGLQKVIE